MPKEPAKENEGDSEGSEPEEADGDPGSDGEAEYSSHNRIIAFYTSDNRVRTIFKFGLANAVIFVDGTHYYVKEMRATLQF